MDIYGTALMDQYRGKLQGKVWLHNSYGHPEEMPIDIFFRPEADMPDLEITALNLCKGKTLDIGAGVGSHALILESRAIDVTALEISKKACEIMKNRGLKKIINTDIMQFHTEKYDTIILLMNGIGLCGDITGLRYFLNYIKDLLMPGGQLVFDSSDIAYLYKPDEFISSNYFGEISYQYEYQNIKGNWFKWLYVDFNTLKVLAEKSGWECEMIYEDDMDQYLVRLIAN
ncbi:MAG: class I SAM-dependent methyltransferase [Bacteroidetes bacterium]|nr:class I SAM-dependent methyltransferase [Bacteroidota bacterium]